MKGKTFIPKEALSEEKIEKLNKIIPDRDKKIAKLVEYWRDKLNIVMPEKK